MMYVIEYYYLDKRGYNRYKRMECGNLDRVKYHCQNIAKLEEHKPIATPSVTLQNDYTIVKKFNFNDFIER